MLTKLLNLDPTNIKEIRSTLAEAIQGLQTEAQQKLAAVQADSSAAGSVKEHMATIETLGRAAKEMEKLEAAATKIMQKVAQRLQKPSP
jgi:hypothetical protein